MQKPRDENSPTPCSEHKGQPSGADTVSAFFSCVRKESTLDGKTHWSNAHFGFPENRAGLREMSARISLPTTTH